MQLSIIIPVYKVEKYIRDTLQSIYRQQYDENLFEVIVINDGTPDDSMRIVAEFTNKHANLHIINQKNQGLSCARNAGLKIAQGEYVWFVDSDDTVTEESIVQVLESMVITPKIVGDSLGISPVVVIVGLMIGGALAGFLGMIIALPIAAFIKILIDTYVFKKPMPQMQNKTDKKEKTK